MLLSQLQLVWSKMGVVYKWPMPSSKAASMGERNSPKQ